MANDKETVSIDVPGTVGDTSVNATFVQRAGLWLASGVGALITIVTIILVLFLWWHYPAMPSAADLKTAESAAAAQASFKALSEIALKNSIEMFQAIVSQALLPVFTAILGYIFAKGGKN